MKVLCVFWQARYDDGAQGEGDENANFVPALRKLSYEVEAFGSLDRREYGVAVAELNAALPPLSMVRSFRAA